MSRSPPPRLFPWVQVLRVVAAGAVAWLHIAHDAITTGLDPSGWLQAAVAFMPWTAGVDLFFVISGFVIVHASSDLFARRHGGRIFLRLRLTRIVPLYWLLTLALLMTAQLDHTAVHGELGGPWYIIASFLFLPVARPDGLVQPALGLGWTLNYEMFFYALMTLFLPFRRNRAVAACAAVLLICVLAGVACAHGVLRCGAIPTDVIAVGFWTSPMLLEFAAGMALALAVAQGLRLSLALRLMVVIIALFWLRQNAALHVAADALHSGPAAVLLVVAAVAAGSAGPTGYALSPALRFGVRLGDASYAMYLIHPFAMRGMALLSTHLTLRGSAAGIAYVVFSLGIAQAAAILINRQLERRLIDGLRRRVRL